MRGEEAKANSEAMARYFKRESKSISIDDQAEDYRQRNMMAVLMNGTDETISGIPAIPNGFVAEAVQAHPDVFLGFGIIDPWQGAMARKELRRCKDLGLHGIGEFNPAR
ncbi:MAG: 4-hydroxyphenyl-beta-ketoacyl-CoA hydrolase, partial [Actinophytocola sp.]|nr:4-hydroxyphenyl-beta-ketoacyl-CoA hydrolase [Actinophytocola sp.]